MNGFFFFIFSWGRNIASGDQMYQHGAWGSTLRSFFWGGVFFLTLYSLSFFHFSVFFFFLPSLYAYDPQKTFLHVLFFSSYVLHITLAFLCYNKYGTFSHDNPCAWEEAVG